MSKFNFTLCISGFAPAPVSFFADNVTSTSLCLSWDNSFPEVLPDQFILEYDVMKLTGQPPDMSQFAVTLNETDARVLMTISQYRYCLTDLYPYTTYSFSLTAVYNLNESAPAQHTVTSAEAGKKYHRHFVM